MRTLGIDHLNLSIPAGGVEEAVAFYHEVLGFPVDNLDQYRAGQRGLFTFRAGDQAIHVSEAGDFEPPARNFNHLAVRLNVSEQRLREVLAGADVEIDGERDRSDRPGADTAIYVEDPFGYTVELRAVEE